MARSFLKIYFDFDEKTDELTDNEKGRLLLAMLRYAMTAQKPVLTGNERFLFSAFKSEIDRDIATYNAKIANGNLGGRPAMEKPNETENNLTKPNVTEHNLNAKNKNKEQEEDIKETHLKVRKEKLRFSPPTIEEVTVYCRERGNRVDPQRFVDFYASKGWKVGHQPMTDWKAAVRTWERDDRDHATPQRVKTVSAQAYTQRQYTEEELTRDSIAELMTAARMEEGA